MSNKATDEERFNIRLWFLHADVDRRYYKFNFRGKKGFGNLQFLLNPFVPITWLIVYKITDEDIRD